jgi:hypothetical protein
MLARTAYRIDLSGGECEVPEPLVLQTKPGDRPRAHETCELLGTIFYVVRGDPAAKSEPPVSNWTVSPSSVRRDATVQVSPWRTYGVGSPLSPHESFGRRNGKRGKPGADGARRRAYATD